MEGGVVTYICPSYYVLNSKRAPVPVPGDTGSKALWCALVLLSENAADAAGSVPGAAYGRCGRCI